MENFSEDSQGKVNYVSWRFQLNLTSNSKGLFLIATGVEAKPQGSDTNEVVKAWD